MNKSKIGGKVKKQVRKEMFSDGIEQEEMSKMKNCSKLSLKSDLSPLQIQTQISINNKIIINYYIKLLYNRVKLYNNKQKNIDVMAILHTADKSKYF